MLIRLGASLVSGIDPHDAADQIDRATVARGGDPRVIWSTVHRLAVERLSALNVDCSCQEADLLPERTCLVCGGTVAPVPTRRVL
jgi:hypothetical protein